MTGEPDIADPAPRAAHRTEIAVRFREVDAYGFAWHGNYFDWLECGRNAYVGAFGFDVLAAAGRGWRFPVVEIACQFKSPARFEDLLVVETLLTETALAKILFGYRITRPSDGKLVATAESVQVVIDRRGELLLALPAEVRELVSRIHDYQRTLAPQSRS